MNLLTRLLFFLPPETAHYLVLKLLRLYGKIPFSSAPENSNPIEILGLKFPNRVGLAAGFDKDAIVLDGLAKLGFGHIEVGTITPRPQPGNAKPRLFRLTKHRAIINRMGFNNAGVDAAIKNIRAARYKGILGINIGKNAATPLERAAEDYCYCLEKVYPYASYVTINISSPNTVNLRSLQHGEQLSNLLKTLKVLQFKLARQHEKYIPLVVKIAPDLSLLELEEIARIVIEEKMDGIIATNTTQSREGVLENPQSKETGGLSGAPLTERSTAIIRSLAQFIQGRIPIIAAGGIMSAEDACEKIEAGASLVQIYTGFIYKGAALVGEINNSLNR
jgi:dihydroorotate dehydrogenase